MSFLDEGGKPVVLAALFALIDGHGQTTYYSLKLLVNCWHLSSSLRRMAGSKLQELHAVRSQRGMLDAFLRFAKLMLAAVAAAWQRADSEQRLRVQNFLFQDGIAYHQNQKFLNTTNPTLFQQLRAWRTAKELLACPPGFRG
jgi:hypothetical protein